MGYVTVMVDHGNRTTNLIFCTTLETEGEAGPVKSSLPQ